jgi:hypothetical protein
MGILRGDSMGRDMGLFNLFGGKKKDEVKASAPVATPAPVKPAETKAAPAKTAPAKPVATAAAAVAAAPTSTGAGQVKLRLKLAHSLRTGERDAAYAAATSLAEIQAKAGRRTQARAWREKAERIKASA